MTKIEENRKKVPAAFFVREAYFRFILRDKFVEAENHLKGLKLHLESLAGDYSEYISCKTETV